MFVARFQKVMGQGFVTIHHSGVGKSAILTSTSLSQPPKWFAKISCAKISQRGGAENSAGSSR